MKKYTRQPQLIKMASSTSQMWVNVVLGVCVPFPFGVLTGQNVEFYWISSWSLPFHVLNKIKKKKKKKNVRSISLRSRAVFSLRCLHWIIDYPLSGQRRLWSHRANEKQKKKISLPGARIIL